MVTWKQRIGVLRAAGMGLAEIGEKVGLSTSSVSDIARGVTKEPGGDAALKIDALYREKSRSARRRSAA
jgi:transcriptional regulator with XRE-family HTH domain